MGQYWDLLCIDNRLRTGQLGKLGEVFNTDPHILEYDLLRHRPVDHPAPTTQPVAPLERLPQLIKRKICAFLAPVDVDGLLCLILATPHLAADGQAALTSRMSWAGKRIITLGNYAESVPRNLLTADEEKCLLDSDSGSGWEINVEAFDKLWKSAMSETYPRAHQFATQQPHVSIRRLVRPHIPQPRDAVLRNLTLKQYYRSSGCCPGGWCKRNLDPCIGLPKWQKGYLGLSDGRAPLNNHGNRFGVGTRCSHHCECGHFKDGRDNTNFGLGQVVLIMTCWSGDSSTSFYANWSLDDVHGEWAGHRLDIVAPEEVPAGWEDVTDAVRAKLMKLRDQPGYHGLPLMVTKLLPP
ncbi:hypothetical protein H4R21_003716 [Coemansia helicoidea]|uniref:Uncharacterized protein n=1 Tax=Coemansia helicoidea TaxID=1286919 RepID=A0ACC1L1G8_9FUNG|nr:hypothetical protein H4R21_003716 [Coemansia helicoidea]